MLGTKPLHEPMGDYCLLDKHLHNTISRSTLKYIIELQSCKKKLKQDNNQQIPKQLLYTGTSCILYSKLRGPFTIFIDA